ncbi:MAG: rhomboid family intramembrane serine protease [Acidobacteriota bacterium]|jgi:rhomboid protease GluP|nr:rhomboid family intramembrane serine protease [Acidobacteriota bacterium]
MLKRQKTGSVLCPSCGKLVGVGDDACFHCGRPNPGMWGFAGVLRRMGGNLGFVPVVIYGCALLYAATLIMDPQGIRMSGLSILSPSTRSLLAFGASGALPVFRLDRWWTVLSAGWLHGGLLHIAFNLLWIRQLAPAAATLYGASRAAIIYTVASVTGFLLSTLCGIQLTVGASAPIFGLLGALVAYDRRTGSRQVGSQALTYAAVLFVFGLLMPNVDNFAHLGGFAGGFVAGRVFNPLLPERVGHTIGALACLGMTALSVIASVATSGIFFAR